LEAQRRAEKKTTDLLLFFPLERRVQAHNEISFISLFLFSSSPLTSSMLVTQMFAYKSAKCS